MAELVQFQAESMISELRKLKGYDIFKQDEIRVIIEKRKEFEYKLQRHCRREEDALKYIKYETDLLNLVIMRIEELALDRSKKSLLTKSLKDRIRNLFISTLRRNPSDVKLWLSYLNFCKKYGLLSSGSIALERMMKFHSDKPSLFKIAALWEYEECCSIEKARKFFLDGLHLHPTSKILLLEVFRMELNITDTKRKEKIVEEVSDESDPLLTGKLAEVFYEEALNKVPEPDFISQFWNILREYPFATELKNKILGDLSDKFPRHEVTWDCLAKNELEDESIDVSKRIENAISKYEEAVETVNTNKMWDKYLEGTLKILNDCNIPPSKSKIYISRTFVRAHNGAKLTEKHYMLWMNYLQGSDDLLESILIKGCRILKNSLGLSKACIKFHLERKQINTAEKIFREAIQDSENSLPLWKLMTNYLTKSDPDKAQKLYIEGLSKISGQMLRPHYIIWLQKNKGIESARQFYQKYKAFPPLSKHLHFKMIQAETKEENVSTTIVRNCFQNLICQFGAEHADVWLRFIDFEEKFGDPLATANIYSRALSTLKNPPAIDEFVSSFNLRKTIEGQAEEDSGSEAEEPIVEEEELTWTIDRTGQ